MSSDTETSQNNETSLQCPAHNLVPMVASLVIDGILAERKMELVHPSLDTNALPGTLNNFKVRVRMSPREKLMDSV